MDEKQLRKFKHHCRRWLKYFETHNREECFVSYVRRYKTPDDYESFGLEMDCFKSYDENSTDPQIIGNGLYSYWRYITHWAYDTFTDFDPEGFMKYFRKIVG